MSSSPPPVYLILPFPLLFSFPETKTITKPTTSPSVYQFGYERQNIYWKTIFFFSGHGIEYVPKKNSVYATKSIIYIYQNKNLYAQKIKTCSKKKDAFVAAFIHHLVTISLVFGSASFGQIRYGGIIMFFFDWADIPLLAAKIFKYLSLQKGDFCQNAANRLFEVFALLFFLTRNVYYTYVVYCAWMDIPGNMTNRICQYMLIALVVLQTYWIGLIIQAAVRQSKNDGNIEDVREDGEEEEVVKADNVKKDGATAAKKQK